MASSMFEILDGFHLVWVPIYQQSKSACLLVTLNFKLTKRILVIDILNQNLHTLLTFVALKQFCERSIICCARLLFGVCYYVNSTPWVNYERLVIINKTKQTKTQQSIASIILLFTWRFNVQMSTLLKYIIECSHCCCKRKNGLHRYCIEYLTITALTYMLFYYNLITSHNTFCNYHQHFVTGYY